MPLGYNRVLGDPRTPESLRPHRVALGGWPSMVDDPRAKTFDAIVSFLVTNGYEGVEWDLNLFKRYMPGESDQTVISKSVAKLEAAGLKNFGATHFSNDNAARQLRWADKMKDQFKLTQDLGGQYVGHQFSIHPDYMNCGGSYRSDEEYLRWCADRVAEVRQAAWDLGMNYYLEVHVDRITEDPQALCRILDLCACELNGDLSHNLARGITRGVHVDRINQHVQHSHVRMARQYGDLSAVVEDPKKDWESKGVTWGLFQIMKPSLAHGYSSRTLVGETGPMHLVKDTLTQEAALVPLYRAMARFADAGAQGVAMKVDEPGDLKPWG